MATGDPVLDSTIPGPTTSRPAAAWAASCVASTVAAVALSLSSLVVPVSVPTALAPVVVDREVGEDDEDDEVAPVVRARMVPKSLRETDDVEFSDVEAMGDAVDDCCNGWTDGKMVMAVGI